ncbi:hypothetical protein AALP_AA5G266000 [Arabis alpina]|uniref:Pentacotripeptide-repeat region of PRORP domain-containing protein n=1 Tax=Arabis alpina TaxID=50452 RepID=A0A087GZJ2_ARAAL|nr:hypothetical protein AALP_AA5G266000 [Arabis alpina]
MSLRRILLGLNLSKLNLSKTYPFRNRCLSTASASVSASATRIVPFPLGKDPSSLSSALTQKLPQNPNFFIDDRPISLRYRVSSMIELCELDKAAEISRLAVLERYRNDAVFISNAIIGAMCDAKRYDEAIALFHYFFNESNIIPNIVSFNHIIKARCDENRVEEALQLFHHARGFDPNLDTCRILTKGLVNAGRIHEAVGLIKAAHLWDSVVYSYLIRGFLDQGNLHMADQLFDTLIDEIPDEVYSYDLVAMLEAQFVDYWFKQGNDELAMEIYNCILPVENWEYIYSKIGNTLLKILLEHGKKSEAWELFNEMIQNASQNFGLLGRRFGVDIFDSETVNVMVDECFKLGHFEEAMDTFKLGGSFVACYNNIIERFCERGMMSEAEGLFEEMLARKDLVLSSHEAATFRSMINGYVKARRVDDAQRILKRMVDASLLKVAIHEAN